MIDHTWNSTVWRLPAIHYSIPKLPPWLTIYVMNTNVFGYQGAAAELAVVSEAAMADEIRAMREAFVRSSGLKMLVGHHPIFTAGKRTFRYNGDGSFCICIPCVERSKTLASTST